MASTNIHVLVWSDSDFSRRLRADLAGVETMDAGPNEPTTQLGWGNVVLAFSFILFNALVSQTFGLGVSTSLVTAAVRCVVQLSLVAIVLQKVFETNNPWGVAGIACE